MSTPACMIFGLSAFHGYSGHRGALFLLAVVLGAMWLLVRSRNLFGEEEHLSAEELEQRREAQGPLPAELDFFE